MIERTTAIPLAVYSHSSTSCIIHWLTRHHGRISTLLKGALRFGNPFMGEYELFSTSELLFFSGRRGGLRIAKECALTERRSTFRKDWRAMKSASYITTLFHCTTPEETPVPDFFHELEALLDASAQFGFHPAFIIWSELFFCELHGNAPHLDDCLKCKASTPDRFCSVHGGVVCQPCAQAQRWATLPLPADCLAIARAWQASDNPAVAVNTWITPQQQRALNAIVGTFMACHFNLQPRKRLAAVTI